MLQITDPSWVPCPWNNTFRSIGSSQKPILRENDGTRNISYTITKLLPVLWYVLSLPIEHQDTKYCVRSHSLRYLFIEVKQRWSRIRTRISTVHNTRGFISLHSLLNHALCNKVLSSFREKSGLVKRDSWYQAFCCRCSICAAMTLTFTAKVIVLIVICNHGKQNCALEKDTVMQISWSKVMSTVETLDKTYIGLHQAIFV